MKKQIIYSKFIPRIFSMTIDLIILSIVLTPLMNLISHYVFLYFFNDFFVTYGVDSSNREAFSKAVRMPEFASYLTAGRFISYSSVLFLLNTTFMATYFITCWRKFGATPGKMFMRMKIVDADTMEKPPLRNLIKRFLGYITAIIGIWSIVFSKRSMAIHDKIANTVVIKS